MLKTCRTQTQNRYTDACFSSFELSSAIKFTIFAVAGLIHGLSLCRYTFMLCISSAFLSNLKEASLLVDCFSFSFFSLVLVLILCLLFVSLFSEAGLNTIFYDSAIPSYSSSSPSLLHFIVVDGHPHFRVPLQRLPGVKGDIFIVVLV